MEPLDSADESIEDTKVSGSDPAARHFESATSSTMIAPKARDVIWWQRHWGRLILKTVPAVVFLTAWELGALILNSILVPRASETLPAVVAALFRSETWEAFLISNTTLAIGYALTVVLAVPLGLLMGRIRAAQRLMDVWLDIVLITPMAALIPLIIMALGLDLEAQVFVVVTFGVPMVAINCRAGVREVPPDLIDMGRCFGASEWQLWRRILLPGASPAIWAGLRIGLGRAILGMIIVELLLSAVGVGRLLQFYRSRFQSEDLYAIVFLLVAESILLIAGMRRLETRLAPWSSRSQMQSS